VQNIGAKVRARPGARNDHSAATLLLREECDEVALALEFTHDLPTAQIGIPRSAAAMRDRPTEEEMRVGDCPDR
jgi:hypothetical protein